eukprot:2698128-Prymnesium_polylepis.1
MRKKYTDFEKIESIFENGVEFARFRCPFNSNECPIPCSAVLKIRADRVSNNKGSRLLEHLMCCTGVDADGNQASDDQRVRDARKAASDASVRLRHVKRDRVADSSAVTSRLEDELRAERHRSVPGQTAFLDSGVVVALDASSEDEGVPSTSVQAAPDDSVAIGTPVSPDQSIAVAANSSVQPMRPTPVDA